MEIFKAIPNHPNYEVSNYGNVKSLRSGKLLKPSLSKAGYYRLYLGIGKTYQIHQLVAIAFLNHIPNGRAIVVDHIDNNPLNNRLDNLQVITNRENLSKDKTGTSKYTGVSWRKNRNKWIAAITINGKQRYLGSSHSETHARDLYLNELKKL